MKRSQWLIGALLVFTAFWIAGNVHSARAATCSTGSNNGLGCYSNLGGFYGYNYVNALSGYSQYGTYWINWTCAGNPTINYIYSSDPGTYATTTYSGGTYYAQITDTNGLGQPGNYIAFFPAPTYANNVDCGGSVQLNIGSAPPVAQTVAFYQPTATTTSDFYQWKLLLGGVSTSTLYRIDVYYQEYGASTAYDDFNLLYPTYVPGIGLINKSQPLTSSFSSTTSWIATAYLMATSSTAIDLPHIAPGSVLSSTTIEFTIGNEIGGATSSTLPAAITTCGTPPLPFFEGTSSAPYFVINDPLPIIEYGICQSFNLLGVPNSSEQADVAGRFSNIQNLISSKPPIGYFTIVQADFADLEGSSTLSFFDASGTAAFSPVLSPVDDGLAILLSLIFGLWVYVRLKNFNFQQ